MTEEIPAHWHASHEEVGLDFPPCSILSQVIMRAGETALDALEPGLQISRAHGDNGSGMCAEAHQEVQNLEGSDRGPLEQA